MTCHVQPAKYQNMFLFSDRDYPNRQPEPRPTLASPYDQTANLYPINDACQNDLPTTEHDLRICPDSLNQRTDQKK